MFVPSTKVTCIALSIIILSTAANAQSSPPAAGPPTLLESLTPSFITVNPYIAVLLPRSILTSETALVVRYILLFQIAYYEVSTVCHPQLSLSLVYKMNSPPKNTVILYPLQLQEPLHFKE